MKRNLLNFTPNASDPTLINSGYISSRIMKTGLPVYKGAWELIFLVQMCIILGMIG